VNARRGPATGAAIAIGMLLAGCAGGSPIPAASGASSSPSASVAPSAAVATATPAASRPAASAAGLDGWSVIKPFSVDARLDGGAIVLTLTHQALWFNHEQGVLVYKPVQGDFRITSTVHARETSDPAAPPGGAGTAQLGGVMARAGTTAEDYVFVVVGDDGNGLTIETKSTDDDVSTYAGPPWTSGDADLRLCRVGTTVTLYHRPAGSTGAWTKTGSYDRPDLPSSLQAGAAIYSGGPPDITVRYTGMTIEPVATAADCTA